MIEIEGDLGIRQFHTAGKNAAARPSRGDIELEKGKLAF